VLLLVVAMLLPITLDSDTSLKFDYQRNYKNKIKSKKQFQIPMDFYFNFQSFAYLRTHSKVVSSAKWSYRHENLLTVNDRNGTFFRNVSTFVSVKLQLVVTLSRFRFIVFLTIRYVCMRVCVRALESKWYTVLHVFGS